MIVPATSGQAMYRLPRLFQKSGRAHSAAPPFPTKPKAGFAGAPICRVGKSDFATLSQGHARNQRFRACPSAFISYRRRDIPTCSEPKNEDRIGTRCPARSADAGPISRMRFCPVDDGCFGGLAVGKKPASSRAQPPLCPSSSCHRIAFRNAS